MTETMLPELINIDKKLDSAIAQAKKYYLEGTIFIYPTDTIYAGYRKVHRLGSAAYPV